MAGTPVADAFEPIYQEDIGQGRAASEAVMGKIAGVINAISNRVTMRLKFGAQGPYSTIVSFPVIEHGLAEPIPVDCQITNIWFRSRKKGGSGSTVIDIQKQSIGSAAWTSIFSTLPEFASNGSDGNRIDTAALISLPTGVIRPVLDPVASLLSAGDILRFNLNSAMAGAEDLTVDMDIKPRT